MKNRIKELVIAICLSSFSLAYGANKQGMAHATMKAPSIKNFLAHIQIVETDIGIKVMADASGLKPNSVHGFHIHENGKCEKPDFKSAGGHLNPNNQHHNGPAALHKHLGDLGNLVANKKGVARTEVFIPKNEAKDLNSLIGKSVIIHSKPDDLATQPSGASGDRIACGIIKAGKL